MKLLNMFKFQQNQSLGMVSPEPEIQISIAPVCVPFDDSVKKKAQFRVGSISTRGAGFKGAGFTSRKQPIRISDAVTATPPVARTVLKLDLPPFPLTKSVIVPEREPLRSVNERWKQMMSRSSSRDIRPSKTQERNITFSENVTTFTISRIQDLLDEFDTAFEALEVPAKLQRMDVHLSDEMLKDLEDDCGDWNNGCVSAFSDSEATLRTIDDKSLSRQDRTILAEGTYTRTFDDDAHQTLTKVAESLSLGTLHDTWYPERKPKPSEDDASSLAGSCPTPQSQSRPPSPLEAAPSQFLTPKPKTYRAYSQADGRDSMSELEYVDESGESAESARKPFWWSLFDRMCKFMRRN
jgi:hypothetical protein